MNARPGECRHCHCTENAPCNLPTGGGETCCWHNKERTVCSMPACVKAETARKDAARPRRPTPADIHQLICRRKAPKRPAKIRGGDKDQSVQRREAEPKQGDLFHGGKTA